MSAETAAADLERLLELEIPAKRAAYSDRTAWLMAVMAELAYEEFDRDGPNEHLRGFLARGDFELKGVLFGDETDTQGFVAIRHPSESALGFTVVAFRGTQEPIDWCTNLKARMVPIYGRTTDTQNEVVGKVHQGFNEAICSVLPQIEDHLKGHENLPVYVTGHSLGGALATLATWYMSGEKLAACYTFGAPRVGNSKLRDRYRTPIYRVVNGADPIPFVPLSARAITLFRNIVRFVSIFVLGSLLERFADWLVSIQGYRHYGESRYLTICKMEPDGTYPGLSVEPAISPFGRIVRLYKRWCEGAWTRGLRFVQYHDKSIYRRKLRFWAEKRQNNVI